jgi:hypothetical protein
MNRDNPALLFDRFVALCHDEGIQGPGKGLHHDKEKEDYRVD